MLRLDLIPSSSQVDVWSQPFAVAFKLRIESLVAGEDVHGGNEPAS